MTVLRKKIVTSISKHTFLYSSNVILNSQLLFLDNSDNSIINFTLEEDNEERKEEVEEEKVRTDTYEVA